MNDFTLGRRIRDGLNAGRRRAFAFEPKHEALARGFMFFWLRGDRKKGRRRASILDVFSFN